MTDSRARGGRAAVEIINGNSSSLRGSTLEREDGGPPVVALGGMKVTP